MKHEYRVSLRDEVFEVFTNAGDEYRELVIAALSELLPDSGIDLEFPGECIAMSFTDAFDITLNIDIDGLAEYYGLEPAVVITAIEAISL